MKRSRYRAKREEGHAFMCVPVWYVIAHAGAEGMSPRQISHILQASPDTVNRRCKDLAKLGWIAPGKGRRWISICRISPDVPQFDSLAGIVSKKPDPTQKIEAHEATVKALQAPIEVLEPTPPPVAPERRTAALARRFDTPEYITGLGDIAVGRVGMCGCGATTPLRYGATHLCIKCAKGGVCLTAIPNQSAES